MARIVKWVSKDKNEQYCHHCEKLITKENWQRRTGLVALINPQKEGILGQYIGPVCDACAPELAYEEEWE